MIMLSLTTDEFAASKQGILEINGVRLDYVEQGDGVPVLFVHGGLSDLRTWSAIAYNRRFHGSSNPLEDGAADPMGVHLLDLSALIRKMGLSRAHLVGNAWGAYACLMLAIREPKLVRSLVLQEPPVLPLFTSPSPKPREMLGLFARSPSTAIAVARFGIKVIKPAQDAFREGDMDGGMCIFAKGVLGSETFNRLPQVRIQQMKDNIKCAKAGLLHVEESLEPFTEEDARAISTPTLLVSGQRSPTLVHGLTDKLCKLLPNVEHVEIPDASGLAHEENAPAYNRVVLEFLSRR